MLRAEQYLIEDQRKTYWMKTYPAPEATAQQPPYKPLKPSRLRTAMMACGNAYPCNCKCEHMTLDSRYVNCCRMTKTCEHTNSHCGEAGCSPFVQGARELACAFLSCLQGTWQGALQCPPQHQLPCAAENEMSTLLQRGIHFLLRCGRLVILNLNAQVVKIYCMPSDRN